MTRQRQRAREVAKTPHAFMGSRRMYDGRELCLWCNQPEGHDVHAAAALAAARLRRAGWAS